MTNQVSPIVVDDIEVSSPKRREGGFVIVYFAVTLIAFVAMAGLGVDLWNLWRTAHEVQRAADAGALGGVPFLPGDLTAARNTAFEMVEANGFSRANATARQGDTPQKLEVSVSTTVRNPFMSLLGIPETTITRRAVAEFVGPVPMGSPDNTLGNDPELHDDGELKDHWLNVASVRNNASNGDRYHAGLCPSNGALGGCASGQITNPSYQAAGHIFAIEVREASGGPLTIQVFDPGFYEVGDYCTEDRDAIFGRIDQAELQARAQASPDIPDDWYDDAAQRYAGGNDRRWCTGDFSAGANTSGGQPITTTYIVREPDNTPYVDTDNPVVTTPSCAPRQFVGRSKEWMRQGGGIMGRLRSTDEGRVVPRSEQTLANTFRRWVTVCEIPNPTVGRYILQVRTNAPMGQPLSDGSVSVNSWGHNRFAIRAGLGSDPSAPSFGRHVSVFANGRLPIYANAEGADTEFYLARILPSGADRILRVSLWDISDGGSSGSMRVVPPEESPTTNFSGCAFSATPSGGFTPNPSQCSFSFSAGALDSRLMEISVPIPSSYTCDEDELNGCWIKVHAPFAGQVNDTTTWSADVVGDPVRLIE